MAMRSDPGDGAKLPAVRRIAGGEAWSVSEVVCSAGPKDRAYEERHDGFSISAVLEGSFTYRAGGSASILYPGALLLGNDGGCFVCGHQHSVGDRCVSFNVRDDALDEARLPRVRGRAAFGQPILPASNALIPLFAAIDAMRDGASPLPPRRLCSPSSRRSPPRSAPAYARRPPRSPGRRAGWSRFSR